MINNLCVKIESSLETRLFTLSVVASHLLLNLKVGFWDVTLVLTGMQVTAYLTKETDIKYTKLTEETDDFTKYPASRSPREPHPKTYLPFNAPACLESA